MATSLSTTSIAPHRPLPMRLVDGDKSYRLFCSGCGTEDVRCVHVQPRQKSVKNGRWLFMRLCATCVGTMQKAALGPTAKERRVGKGATIKKFDSNEPCQCALAGLSVTGPMVAWWKGDACATVCVPCIERMVRVLGH